MVVGSQPLFTQGIDGFLPGQEHLHNGVPVAIPGPALFLLQQIGQAHLTKLVSEQKWWTWYFT